MKKFIISVVGVALFFIGLGALVEKTGAKFKSDEKALELIRKARQAVGGESAVASVKSLRIVGMTTRSITTDGVARVDQGETEIALQLPDRMIKMVKIGDGDPNGSGQAIINREVEVLGGDAAGEKKHFFVRGEGSDEHDAGPDIKKIVIKKDDGTVQEYTGADADKFIASENPVGDGEHKIVIKKKADGSTQETHDVDRVFIRKGGDGTPTWTSKDGTNANDGDKKHFVIEHANTGSGEHHVAANENEMLRLTLGLLLTAPKGMDVSYKYVGESTVDGSKCNIVAAELAGKIYQLFLDKASNLPVMLNFEASRTPATFHFRTEGPAKSGDDTKGTMVFTRKSENTDAKSVEMSIKFSDFRFVNGVRLPFRWTQTVGGVTDETFNVTSYEINPANIGDKFQDKNVMFRSKSPDIQ